MGQNEILKQGRAPNRDFMGFSDLCDLDQPVDLTSRNLNTQLMRLPTENIENTERMTADPSENFRDPSIVTEQEPENSEIPVTVTRGG